MTISRACRACFLHTSSPAPLHSPFRPSPRPLTKASPSAASSGTYPRASKPLPSAISTSPTRLGCKLLSFIPRAAPSPSNSSDPRYAPISPESFEAEVYTQFYDPNASVGGDQPLLAHRLSLMFIVLAIGSLMDTNEPAYNLEAEKYHQLARAA